MLKVRDWDESKHPRGQPDNAGEFGPGGAAAKAHNTPHPGPNATKAITASSKMSRETSTKLAAAIEALAEKRASHPLPDPEGPVSVETPSFPPVRAMNAQPSAANGRRIDEDVPPGNALLAQNVSSEQRQLELAIRTLAAKRAAHPLHGETSTAFAQRIEADALGDSLEDDASEYTPDQVWGNTVRSIARSQEWMAHAVDKLKKPALTVMQDAKPTLAERVSALLVPAR
jgi:hypothetical protein